MRAELVGGDGLTNQALKVDRAKSGGCMGGCEGGKKPEANKPTGREQSLRSPRRLRAWRVGHES